MTASIKAGCSHCHQEVVVPIDLVHVTDTHVGYRCDPCGGKWRWKKVPYSYVMQVVRAGALAMRGTPISDSEALLFRSLLSRVDDLAGWAEVEMNGRA